MVLGRDTATLAKLHTGKLLQTFLRKQYQSPVNMKNRLVIQGDRDEKDIPLGSSQRNTDDRCHSSRKMARP